MHSPHPDGPVLHYGCWLACGKFNKHPSVLPEPREGMVASGQGPVGREGSGARPPETPACPLPPPLVTPGLSEPQSLLLEGFKAEDTLRGPHGLQAPMLTNSNIDGNCSN